MEFFADFIRPVPSTLRWPWSGTALFGVLGWPIAALGDAIQRTAKAALTGLEPLPPLLSRLQSCHRGVYRLLRRLFPYPFLFRIQSAQLHAVQRGPFCRCQRVRVGIDRACLLQPLQPRRRCQPVRQIRRLLTGLCGQQRTRRADLQDGQVRLAVLPPLPKDMTLAFAFLFTGARLFRFAA